MIDLFHDDFDLPGAEVLNETIEFCSFDAQKLNFFLLISDADLEVELFVGDVDAMKLCGIDIVYSEVEDGFGDEDDALFQHVEPAGLSLDVGFEAGLVLLRFEVVAGLNQVYVGGCMQQIDKDLELGSCVFGLDVFEMWSFFEQFWVDFGLDVDCDLFFDLDDDVAINGLSLVDGSVFVEL